jgi:hypothetical protein
MTICARAYGQSSASEDAVKAAYIFHFINFTEWQDNSKDYYVCVPDDENLREELETSLEGKIINNRKVVVLNHGQLCHVLVSDQPVLSSDTLTIGPIDKGALLEFRVANNKLKFAANLQKIRESNLKISSQVLKLAVLENP